MKETTCTAVRYLVSALMTYSGVGAPLAAPVSDFIGAALNDWWEHLNKSDSNDILVVLENLAQSTPSEVLKFIKNDTSRIDDPILRARIEAYLARMPESINQSMPPQTTSRGTTIPHRLLPKSANDLKRIVPERLPHFHAGVKIENIGDLQLIELLSTSELSEVWLAQNPNIPSQKRVLKFFFSATCNFAEVKIYENLQRSGMLSSGIVPILHTFLDAVPPCIAYEYIPGPTLSNIITDWHTKLGVPSPEESGQIIFRIAEIMGSCHSHSPPIVHCDLKPSNILAPIRTVGDLSGSLRITDFGIGLLTGGSMAFYDERMSSGIYKYGYTAIYASPDRISGKSPVPADDVYSIGVIWWQIIMGDIKSPAPSGTKWIERVRARGYGEKFIGILSACIENDVSDRISSGAELASRLRLALQHSDPITVWSDDLSCGVIRYAMRQGKETIYCLSKNHFESQKDWGERLSSLGRVEVGRFRLSKEDYIYSEKRFNLPNSVRWRSFVPSGFCRKNGLYLPMSPEAAKIAFEDETEKSVFARITAKCDSLVLTDLSVNVGGSLVPLKDAALQERQVALWAFGIGFAAVAGLLVCVLMLLWSLASWAYEAISFPLVLLLLIISGALL
jgi:serine/threonine protein kinase